MSRIGSGTQGRAWRARLLAGLVATGLAVAWSAPAAHAATGVSNITVSNASPSTAASAQTTYAIGFKTSASGALLGSASANITITLPTGTVIVNLLGSPLMVGATQVGFCQRFSDSAPVAVQCYVYSNETIAAGATVAITLNGVNNPPTTGTDTLQIATSADTATRTSPSYSVTAAKAVTKPSVTITTPSPAANAKTTYAIGFTTSSTGALSGAAGSTINISLPTGTGLADLLGSPLMAGATQVGFCQIYTASPPLAHCYVYNGTSVPASTTLAIAMNGMINPGAGSKTLTVTTTSDTKSVTSATYTVTAVSSISGLSVHITPPSASAGALTTYAIGFKTSATGGLNGVAGSRIDIALPAGTALSALRSSPLSDGGNVVGLCQQNTASPPVASCYVYSGDAVVGGDSVSLLLNGVNNPKTSGAKTLHVSTTSDTAVKTSPTYTVGAVSSVSGASITLSSTTTGAAVDYTVRFTATNGLAGDTGSTFALGFPSGTKLTALTTSPVMDGATQVGYCQDSTATVVTCYVYSGDVVSAGDHLVASIMGAKNPTTTKQYSLKLSTTSDPKVKSVPYCVAAVGVPCITKFSPASGPVATAVTINGINLGGATAVKFNGKTAAIGSNNATKITTSVPTGATTGTITVTTGGGTATSTKQFTVL